MTWTCQLCRRTPAINVLIWPAAPYRGQLAEPFWQDEVTCIDLDQRSPQENASLVKAIADDPKRHRRMCEAIWGEFRGLVDYDREAETIAAFLGVRRAVAA